MTIPTRVELHLSLIEQEIQEQALRQLEDTLRELAEEFNKHHHLPENTAYHNMTFNALLSAGVGTLVVGGIYLHSMLNVAIGVVTLIAAGVYGNFPTPND